MRLRFYVFLSLVVVVLAAVGCIGPEIEEPRLSATGVQGQALTRGLSFKRTHIGSYRTSSATFTLKGPRPGWNEAVNDIPVGFGSPGNIYVPLMGDWDANFTETMGIYEPGAARFILKDSFVNGAPDYSIVYGYVGDKAVVGDWDGNQSTTIGVFRPGNATFYLSNSNTTPNIAYIATYGSPGDLPLACDWDGNGTDTIGVFRPSNYTFYLRNSNTTGVADITVQYGQPGDMPVVGDWDDDGVCTIGIYRPSANAFYLRNSNTVGAADIIVGSTWVAGDQFVTGNWGSNDQAYGAAPASLTSFFPLAVDFQSYRSFATWKARGFNSVIRYPFNIAPVDTPAEWAAGAKAQQLMMIESTADGGADGGYVNDNSQWMLAVNMYDEPELKNLGNLGTVQGLYSTLKTASPTRPAFTNFAGPVVLGMATPDYPCDGLGDAVVTPTCYPSFLPYQDWLSMDIYPVNDFGGNISLIGQALDKLHRWAPSKPLFSYIEACDYGTGHVPTVNQFRGEMWTAIIHGARGLFFFTAKVLPKGSEIQDNMPVALRTEFGIQAGRITGIASVLQSAINPPGFGFGGSMPLEVTWRQSGGHTYFFVLNNSNTTVTKTFGIWGVNTAGAPFTVLWEGRTTGGYGSAYVTDTFTPYQLHVYML